MIFREVFAFDVAHGALGWPWIAFGAGGQRFAAATSFDVIASYGMESGVVAGATFVLPNDARIEAKASEGSPRSGLVAFSLDGAGARLALASTSFVATLDASGERTRANVDDLVGADHEVHAIAFDRTGTRIWLTLESATETVIALLDASTLRAIDVVRTPAFPRPALHEIHLHPHDDAILLLAACGQDGTFARVVGFAGTSASVVPTALDGGSISAGLVGFSARGSRVHLAEADELRTHTWPGLDTTSSVPFLDDFVSSYSGAVLGENVLVDGEFAETHDDAAMLFDATGAVGAVLSGSVPTGMWAGPFGTDAIVTVEAKGEPSRARVWRASPSKTGLSN